MLPLWLIPNYHGDDIEHGAGKRCIRRSLQILQYLVIMIKNINNIKSIDNKKI